ncbi:serine/threonine-protein phosphatase [Chloroflexales bacterium ZM16-3]|nr:serine/threonine-protein phosphatase [Chloroflexales bacterium ZM16-3]
MTTTSSRDTGTLIGATYTDQGGRQRNEDSIGLEFTNDGLFAIVADGMGGGIDGKLFSEQAVTILHTYLSEAPSRDSLTLEHGIAQVAREINSLRQGNPDYKVSGTTLVALVLRLHDGRAEGTIASIGDSRAYRIPAEGPARQITRDHTYAEQLISSGTNEVEAYQHKQALRLTYALGDALALESVPDLFIDVLLQPGERLLLCTDGVCKHLSDDQLAQLARGAEPTRATEDIARAAIAAGSKDNVSAAIIGYAVSSPKGRRPGLLIATLLAILAIAIGSGAVYARYRAALAQEVVPAFDATVTPLPKTSTLLPATSTPALLLEQTSTIAPSITPTPTSTPTSTPTATSTLTPVPPKRPTRTQTREVVNTTPTTTVSSTPNPGTTDPGITDPGITDPGTTDPGTTDPGTTDPGITDPGPILAPLILAPPILAPPILAPPIPALLHKQPDD